MPSAEKGDAERPAMLPLDRQNAYRVRYSRLRPGWRPATAELESAVRKYITGHSRVLDLGCGRGGVVELLWRDVGLAAGVDSDVDSLAEHRAPGMPLVAGAAERLPFLDSVFDLIVCVWVLEHLADPVAVLRDVRRILRVGGHFMFLTPNLRHPLMLANRIGRSLPGLQRSLVPRVYGRQAVDTFPVRYRANTPRAIRGLAAHAGLELVELRTISDPTYTAFNDAMFRLSVGAERLLPHSWGVHLLGDLTRSV